MKCRTLLRVALGTFAFLSVSSSQAAAQAGTSVLVFAGAAIPTGDAGDVLSTGYHLGGGFQFQPALTPLGLRFDGGFTQHNVKNANDLRQNLWHLTGNAVMNLAADNPIYLLGGLGFYSLSSSGSSNSATKTGINVGGGFRLPLMGFGAFIEARYHHLFDSSYRTIPITFGVSF
jgi:hypothetical protein